MVKQQSERKWDIMFGSSFSNGHLKKQAFCKCASIFKAPFEKAKGNSYKKCHKMKK